MSIFFDVARDVLNVGGFHLGYEYTINAALDLDIVPSSLLVFGATALSVTQLLHRLPSYLSNKPPFFATNPINHVVFWGTATATGAFFGKHMTEYATNNPLSWNQTVTLTASKITVILTQGVLGMIFEKLNP